MEGGGRTRCSACMQRHCLCGASSPTCFSTTEQMLSVMADHTGGAVHACLQQAGAHAATTRTLPSLPCASNPPRARARPESTCPPKQPTDANAMPCMPSAACLHMGQSFLVASQPAMHSPQNTCPHGTVVTQCTASSCRRGHSAGSGCSRRTVAAGRSFAQSTGPSRAAAGEARSAERSPGRWRR